jgi:hypothetical protein
MSTASLTSTPLVSVEANGTFEQPEVMKLWCTNKKESWIARRSFGFRCWLVVGLWGAGKQVPQRLSRRLAEFQRNVLSICEASIHAIAVLARRSQLKPTMQHHANVLMHSRTNFCHDSFAIHGISSTSAKLSNDCD